MSIEKSMEELAKSQLALATAMTKLAEQYERVIAGEASLAVPGSGAADSKTDAAPVTRGRGRPSNKDKDKAAAAAASTDDDGLGGEEEEEEEEEEEAGRTSDEVKAKLQEFKAKGGKPVELMSKFGAKAFPDVKEADFTALYDATVKALKKLG